MQSFDVVIIGGGWSGLLMLKHALEQKLSAVVLEARETFGGVWAFSEDPSIVTVTETTETTSSTCFTEAADFPMPKDREFLMHHEVFKYLQQYADKFELLPHVHLGQRVSSCEKVQGGALWKITTQSTTYHSRKLVVASGVHGRRNSTYESQLFERAADNGEAPVVRHMGEIKRVPPEFAGRRILVVGGGESASDLIEAMMVAGSTGRVLWSIPNGQHFFRKYGYWMRRHPITRREVAPQAFDKQTSLLQGLISPAYKGKDGMRWGCKWTTSGSMLAYQGHGVPEWRSHAKNMHAFVNKSANALDYLDGVRLAAKGAISSVRGKTVYFRDGSSEEVDHVVLCTGYAPEFSFLPAGTRETCLTLRYKYVFDNEDPSLAFVGFVRPIFGSIPLISEVQSRWVAQVFAGKLELPEHASRWRKTLREKAFWEDFFKDTSRRIHTLVDIFIYTYGISRLTGEFPDRKRLLFEDPRAWYLSVVGPFCSAMLTLNDPAKREHAKEVLDHHRLIRLETWPYVGFQVAAKLTGFDRILSVLEDVRYEAQKSPVVKQLAATSVGKALDKALSLPRELWFVPSWNYPWYQKPSATGRWTKLSSLQVAEAEKSQEFETSSVPRRRAHGS